MEPDPSTYRLTSNGTTLGERASHWLLLGGSRLALAAIIVTLIVLGTWWLITTGILAVGADSSVATLFASGLTAGTVTLVTIALSINQLILSRVFGSPNELINRLDGTRDLRQRVESLAEEPSSPTDPAAFLGLIGRTLQLRIERLQTALDGAKWDAPDDVLAFLRDLDQYGEYIDRHSEPRTPIVDILVVVLGTEYAENIRTVEHFQSIYEGEISTEVSEEFESVLELLESIAVTRQFFKTISLQQDFAHLSRLIASLGVVSLLTSVGLTLLYRTSTLTLPASSMPLIVSIGIGIILTPLIVFIVYILRAATIAYRTLSVGPFIPPRERSGWP